MLIKSYIGYEMTSGKIIQWHTLNDTFDLPKFLNIFIFIYLF